MPETEGKRDGEVVGSTKKEGAGSVCVCVFALVGRIAIVKGMSLLLEWACWSLAGMGLCLSES